MKYEKNRGWELNVPRFILHPLSLILAFALASCASQQPPPGGPVDTTRPKIDSSWPHERELNVRLKPRIYFQFGQDIDESSFEQAFSITPYMNGTPKFRWSGHNQVHIELPELLRDSTTYTVQLSRDLKSRRGNKLPAPFLLTFSTGFNIDTGMLSGYLLTPIDAPPMNPSNLFLFAYDISVEHPDTLNFERTTPDLITQPNDQGLWQFLAMKVGHRYRVYAIGDVYRNKVYDAGVDAFGVPAGDAVLDSSVKTGFYIRMSPHTDTINPELEDAEVVDSFHVRAHFSEAIDSNSVRPGNFSLSNLPIVAAFRENPEKHPNQVMLVTAAPLAPDHSYILEALRNSIHDLASNPLSDSAYRDTVTTPSELHAPTAPAFGTMFLRDSTRDLAELPSFPILFTDAVNKDSAQLAVKLIDTAHHAVPITFHWTDDAKAHFKPVDTLSSSAFYTLEIYTRFIQSPVALMPRTPKDTVLRFHFKTANVRDFGTIQGTIAMNDSFFAQSPKSALVVQLLDDSRVSVQKILPHGMKDFEFDQVQTGTFRILAYLSRDGSGRYDPGSVQPWRFGVPTGEYPKPIDTRPRWTMADIDFDVK